MERRRCTEPYVRTGASRVVRVTLTLLQLWGRTSMTPEKETNDDSRSSPVEIQTSAQSLLITRHPGSGKSC